MLAANRSLIHLISRLMSDADEREKFQHDGEGYLRHHGLDDVSGEDIADAMPFVFEDLADDAVAARFTAYAGGAGPGEGFDLSRSFGDAPPRPPMRLQGESDLESAVRHLNHLTAAETTVPLDDAMFRNEVIDSSFKREILGSRVTRFLDDDRLDETLDTGNGDDGHLAAVRVGVGQAGREELFGDDPAIDSVAGESYSFGGRGDPAAAVDGDEYSVGHVAPGDHTTTLDGFDAGGTPSAPLRPAPVGPPDSAADFAAGSGGDGDGVLVDAISNLDGHVAAGLGLFGPDADVLPETAHLEIGDPVSEPEPPADSAPVPEPDPEPDPQADPYDGIG